MSKLKMIAPIVCAAALLAACGATPAAEPTHTQPTGFVAVAARLLLVGGPAPGISKPIVGGEVSASLVREPESRPVKATTDANGVARFNLRPGTYEFVGRQGPNEKTFWCRTYKPPATLTFLPEQPLMGVTVTCSVP